MPGDNRRGAFGSWGYGQAVAAVLSLVLLGAGAELVIGRPVPRISYPVNAMLVCGAWVLLLLVHVLFNSKPLVRWLSSVRLSAALLIGLFFLALITGVVPQQDIPSSLVSRVGITHVTRSWAFAYLMMALLVNIGLTSLRWTRRQGVAAAGFTANHLGVWVVLAAGMCAAGDRLHVLIEVVEGQQVSHGRERYLQTNVSLPFSVELHDFSMESFEPSILLLDNAGSAVVDKREKPGSAEKGQRFQLGRWSVEVLESHSSAYPVSEGYLASDKDGAVSAALLSCRNMDTGGKVEGWVSSGSFLYRPKALKLDESYKAGMPQPQARLYQSIISVEDQSGSRLERYPLQVNKPAVIGAWRLYQLGYDELKGRWSKLSVIEAVFDPWLWVVYGGLMLMALGTVYIMCVRTFQSNVG